MSRGEELREQEPLRRQPRQERGRRRVELILHAAAAEFADVGYDEATTNGIAARAGISIGSLYQFFPSKRALLTALARHHLSRLDALTAAAVPAAPQTLRDLLDPVIDAVLTYCASTPSLPPLLTGTIASSDVTRVTGELHTALVQRVEHLLAGKRVSAERRRLAATVSVRILTAVLPDAVNASTVNPAVAAELKTALAAYLTIATGTK